MGKLKGIPDHFPALIGNNIAEVTEAGLDYTEFKISHAETEAPHPFKGFLTGGDSSNAISPFDWNLIDLKNLILHSSDLPVYFFKDNQLTEIMPVKAYAL